MIGILAALVYGLLAWALCRFGWGKVDPGAVYLASAAWLACLAGALVRWPRRIDELARPAMPFVFVGVVLANLYGLWTLPPGGYVQRGTSLLPLQVMVGFVGVLTVTWLWRTMPLGSARVWLAIAGYVVLGVWMIHVSPRPFIDVWYFEQRAAELLLHGHNPYAADYPNIYGHARWFGAEFLNAAGRVQSHTYPPASVLMTLPGWVIGDVRYSSVASVAGAAALVVAMLRRLGAPAGHFGELGAVVLLFHARSLFLIEQSWTEPFIALAACACAYALVATRHRLLRVALAGFLSIKQYGLFWLPSLAVSRRLRLADFAWAIAISAVIALPFFIWDPRALWQGVVAYQFRLGFRGDSLTVPALILARTGKLVWPLIGFVVAGGTALVVAWRQHREHVPVAIERVAIGGGAVYLAFFLFHKQAFFNYYWFAGVFAAMAMAGAAAPQGSGGSERASEPAQSPSRR